MLSTDLNDLKTELATARPNYFLNVPTLLERVKNGVESKLRQSGPPVRKLYATACAAYQRKVTGRLRKRDKPRPGARGASALSEDQAGHWP